MSAVRPAIGELTNAKRCGGTYLLSRGYPLPTAVRALQEEGGDHTLNAVLFIDLDDFKRVNDTMGHEVGDRVLVAVADRIRASLRPTDVAARLGGDEFAVLVDRASNQPQLDAIARRILQALREPAEINGGIIPSAARSAWRSRRAQATGAKNCYAAPMSPCTLRSARARTG